MQRAAIRCAAYLLTASCSSRSLFSCFASSCCSICCFTLPSDSSLSSPRFCSCRMPLDQAHRFAGFIRYESAEGSARVGDVLGCAAASWIALLRANRCHVSLLWRRQAGCGRACPPCTYRSGRGSPRSPDRLSAARGSGVDGLSFPLKVRVGFCYALLRPGKGRPPFPLAPKKQRGR